MTLPQKWWAYISSWLILRPTTMNFPYENGKFIAFSVYIIEQGNIIL